MDIKEAIKERHSVRQYKDEPIPEDIASKLQEMISASNEESGLHIQLIQDDPECFNLFLAHYGVFTNVKNYIAIVGPKIYKNLEELGGYYGQKVVLAAQMLGLNTCWVGGTFRRGKCKAEMDVHDKLVCVIAIGYGETEGKKHTSKPLEKHCKIPVEDMPAWFRNGVTAARMAPTAMNQQKFFIGLDGEEAVITAGKGIMTKIDLGIVKYNFEAASGHKCR